MVQVHLAVVHVVPFSIPICSQVVFIKLRRTKKIVVVNSTFNLHAFCVITFCTITLSKYNNNLMSIYSVYRGKCF